MQCRDGTDLCSSRHDIKVLQDEETALKLELESRNRQLQELRLENQQLTERWLRKMNEEVSKMNEANQYYETYRSKVDITMILYSSFFCCQDA